jgi:predicted enzyme related to lactoylglutathione lyase
MASAVLNITFDCRDPDKVSAFWQSVTGGSRQLDDDPRNPYWVVEYDDGRWPRMVFVAVPEEKRIKNRVHLDLVPTNMTQEAEGDRLLGLGAQVVDDRRAVEPGGWIVMTDPEGNEFCVEPGLDE